KSKARRGAWIMVGFLRRDRPGAAATVAGEMVTEPLPPPQGAVFGAETRGVASGAKSADVARCVAPPRGAADAATLFSLHRCGARRRARDPARVRGDVAGRLVLSEFRSRAGAPARRICAAGRPTPARRGGR